MQIPNKFAPKSTTILGWTWSDGTICATQHRVATLSSCALPHNVKALRSFIGAYKVLVRVIPKCAGLMTPLDTAVAGRLWSDELRSAFAKAQSSLSSRQSITLPRPSDTLWIVTDGTVKNSGIGATLYAVREGKPLLAGFFCAKLRAHQIRWIPCEVEALGIATAIKHFQPIHYPVPTEAMCTH